MLKQFDIFPKSVDNDLRVRTNFGGFLTLTSVLFMFHLLLFEFYRYFHTNESDQMVLNNQPLPPYLPIQIDLLVYNNCSSLHFEVTNLKRTILLDVNLKQNFIPLSNGQCRINITGEIPNVPGSFHIGLGESYFTDLGIHQHLWYTISDRNLSHKIKKIRFGQLNIPSPIDGIEVITPNQISYMHTYSLQLVPVEKHNFTGYMAIGSFAKTNLDKIRTNGITAIIFKWSFSAIRLSRSKVHEPIINFISHICALCGCGFVFVQFIDYVVFSLTGGSSSTL